MTWTWQQVHEQNGSNSIVFAREPDSEADQATPAAVNSEQAFATRMHLTFCPDDVCSIPLGHSARTPALTATRTPKRGSTKVPTPTRTPTFTPTLTPTGGRTATATPTYTPTVGGTPTCSTCNGYFISTDISCNADGTVHWRFGFRNSGSCTVYTPVQVQLTARNGFTGSFYVVATTVANGVFPPGDTYVSGDICYHFQTGQTNIQMHVSIANPGGQCTLDYLSPFIDVCAVTPTCGP